LLFCAGLYYDKNSEIKVEDEDLESVRNSVNDEHRANFAIEIGPLTGEKIKQQYAKAFKVYLLSTTCFIIL
jgi:hypothetical protein